jgi:hypothetical protein
MNGGEKGEMRREELSYYVEEIGREGDRTP